MPASEYILVCISLLSFSSSSRITDELWNIKSALYLYSTLGPAEVTRTSGTSPCVKLFDENNSNYTLEAKGIKPDIQTTSDSALSVAYSLSLSGNTDTAKGKTKYFKKQKLIVDEREEFFAKKYADYIGDYRKIVITKENEKLYMTYDLYSKQILVPDANDFFLTNDFEFVRFTRNTENRIVEIQVRHKDGYLEKFRKQ